MYLHNTTFKVDLDINNDFIYFIKNNIITELLLIKNIQDAILLELLNIDNSDGNTYCLHIVFDDLVAHNEYKINFENKFLSELYTMYQEKVLHFSSILKKI